MRTALFNGKTVHAGDLSWENKKYIYTCPECGKDLRLVISPTENYPNTFRHRYRESCVGTHTYVRQHSLEECEELQELSDINALLLTNGEIHSLSFGQRRNLRACGFLKMMGRNKMEFTEKALKILGQNPPPVTPPVVLPVKCPHCPRTFRNKHGLSIHIGKMHSNIPPFKCLHCPRAFGTHHGVLTHIGKMHKEHSQPPPTPPIIPPDVSSIISSHWDTIMEERQRD